MSEQRGTITLLPDGRVVIGIPPSVKITQQQAEELAERIAQWQSGYGPLIVSWPVDVVDMRASMREVPRKYVTLAWVLVLVCWVGIVWLWTQQ